MFRSICFVSGGYDASIVFAVTAFKKAYGGIAQLVEHLPCKQGVSGSIPLASTKIF